MPYLGANFGGTKLAVNEVPPVNCYFEVVLFPGYLNGLKMSKVGMNVLYSSSQGLFSRANNDISRQKTSLKSSGRYIADLLWYMASGFGGTLMAAISSKDEHGGNTDKKGNEINNSRVDKMRLLGANILDFRFNKVSGFSARIETEEINVGGINQESIHQPMRVVRENLVLERGIFKGSPLTFEFNTAMTLFQMMPGEVLVVMQNPENEGNRSIQGAWLYRNAFPVAWSNSDLWSDDNDVAMEKMEFAYSHVIPLRY